MHFDAPLSTFFCLARWLSSSFRARFSSSSTRARDTRQRRGTRTHRHRSSRKKEREKRGEERERFSFFCSGREIEKGFRRRRVRRSGGGGEEKKKSTQLSTLFIFLSFSFFLPPSPSLLSSCKEAREWCSLPPRSVSFCGARED